MRENLDVAIAMAYAPANARPVLDVLFDLDDVMIRLIRSTREPMLGEIKLQWWIDQIEAIQSHQKPASHPILEKLKALDLPLLSLQQLLSYCEGWRHVLVPQPFLESHLIKFSEARASLISVAGSALNIEIEIKPYAFQTWCLLDFSRNSVSKTVHQQVSAIAENTLKNAQKRRLNKALRPFDILGAYALHDVKKPQKSTKLGSPKRMWQAFHHVLFNF